MKTKDETTLIREAAKAAVGLNATQPRNLRIATCWGSGRLQQQWIGEFGSVWLDVPNVEVDLMPSRLGAISETTDV
jgi:hypothetical protein